MASTLFLGTGPRMYPELKVSHIQNPNRLYAVPLLGFLVKILMLIPVGIWLIILSFVSFFVVVLVNPFFVLFTGKYWDLAYKLTLGVMRLTARSSMFFGGLTDTYPGFSLENEGDVSVNTPIPQNPNKLFAIPLLGGVIRIVLLIPYLIWNNVLTNASFLGMIGSSIPVLFMGKYPESTYELYRDSARVSLGASTYMSGLSDTYPSFWISMNHKGIKIVLLVLGALMTITNSSDSKNSQYKYQQQYQYQFPATSGYDQYMQESSNEGVQ